MKAIYNGVVIAQSDETIVIEGNHYFPPSSIEAEYLRPSDWHTTCPWKGQASYYHLAVNGETLTDGVWVYPDTQEQAKAFEGYFAFYTHKGIEVIA